MSDLRTIVARTLAAEGAIVDAIEPDGLEIVAPPHVQKALSIPEWSRIGFGEDLPAQTMRVSIESDWAERLELLMGERGRYAHAFLQERPHPIPQEQFEKLVRRDFVLQNATFRLGRPEETRACYLLLAYRVTASSDEKREELCSMGINESNGALAEGLLAPVLGTLRSLADSGKTPPDEAAPEGAWPVQKVQSSASRLLLPRIRAQLAPFLSGMERRMARDLERLHAYHTDLRLEIARRMAEKKRKGEDPDAQASDRMRLETVEREYHAKVADLKHKYAMVVEVRLLQAFRVNMPVRRAEVIVLRRKGSRQTHLDWNPAARKLDQLPCEGCWSPARRYFVCDDRLHWVCPSCLSPCLSCGKEFCRACHLAKCPRCARQGP
jgi:hypothetical protein